MDRVYKREVETGCEYTLPDYMGDIKRVLTSSAAVVPTGKFPSDGQIELSGLVNYEITYADSEGKLTALTASSDLDVREAVGEGFVDASVRTTVKGVSVRVAGPRKLSVKSVVSVFITVAEDRDLSVIGDAFSDSEKDCLEIKTGTVSCMSSHFFTSGEREYAEEAERLVGVTSDEVEVIATSGRVNVLEAIPESGGVVVKGEMVITSIVRTPEQPPFAIRKVIPFEERITVEGAEADEAVMAEAYLTSQTTGLSEDGDATVVSVNAICEVSLAFTKNREVEITEDAFLTSRDTEQKYEELRYTELLGTTSGEFEVDYSFSREECGMADIRDILTLDATATVTERKSCRDGVEISGEIHLCGVACEVSVEGKASYLPVKAAFPYTIHVNSSCHFDEECELECRISPTTVRYQLDSERLSATVTLHALCRACCERRATRLSECRVAGDGVYSSSPSEIVVYYPDPEETLFEVAKMHRASVKKIAEINGISMTADTASRQTLASLGYKHLTLL